MQVEKCLVKLRYSKMFLSFESSLIGKGQGNEIQNRSLLPRPLIGYEK